MNTFKSAKWDFDAENDTFQELFQKRKKNKPNKIIKSQNKKIEERLKKVKNKIKKNVNLSHTNVETTDTVNLIKKPSSKQKLTISKKRRLRKLQAKIQNKGLSQNLNQNNLFNLISETQNQSVGKNKNKKFKRNVKDQVDVALEKLGNINNSIDATSVEKKKHKTAIMESKNKKKKNKLKNTLDQNETKDKEEFSVNASSKFKRKIKKEIPKIKKNIDLKSDSSNEKLLEQKSSSLRLKKKEKFFGKLKEALYSKEKKPIQTLRQKMMEKLKSARFRFINEQIYTTDSKEAQKIFLNDPDAYMAYHDGYRKQVKSWPMNPLDVIIDSIKKMPKIYIIADFGCGDARLAKSVVQKVNSFDLVAANENVVACDMSKVPLENNSVDVAVFCLSLMGTNLKDYLFEANRVLKVGGLLKIAEVESRFENVEDFIKGVQYFGFKKTWKDLSHNLFYFIDFKKEKDIKNRNKLPTLSLLPCLYKKR